MSLTGLLPLNKPVGVRSSACVETVRRILGRKIKVGHGGTLDSTASGLLVLLIGPATRLSSYIMEMPKRYRVVIQLGCETTTDDFSGEITKTAEWRSVTDEMIDSALPAFYGVRMQLPPQISAVRVNGERAHRLVRDGKEALIEGRYIHVIKIIRLDSLSAEGRVKLDVTCHKGTYIRSLARDLGRMLDSCGAHVSELLRVSSGPFSTSEAPGFELLSQLSRGEMEKYILPLESLHEVSARYVLEGERVGMAQNGCPQLLSGLRRGGFGRFTGFSSHVLLTADGIFSICDYQQQGDTLRLQPSANIFYGGGRG